jgi:hypothetical protein
VKNVTVSPRVDLPLGAIRLEAGRPVTTSVTDAVTGAPIPRPSGDSATR